MMPRRATTILPRKLPDHPPRFSPDITAPTTFDIKTAEETFNQMYEEALSEAFASRLNTLFDGSFDERFEHHFNSVYSTFIKRNFDSVFNRITEKKSQMGGGDQGSSSSPPPRPPPSSSSSSTTGGMWEVESTNIMPPKAIKRDYQPQDIIRRKVRHGISRDIRKEVLFRVREAVKKDLEPEVRKAITKEAFWDLLKESQFNIDQEGMDKIMARTTRLLPKGPRSMMSTTYDDYDNDDDDDSTTVMGRPTNIPTTSGGEPQSKSKGKDEDIVIGPPNKVPQDVIIMAARTSKLPVKVPVHSKPKDQDLMTRIKLSAMGPSRFNNQDAISRTNLPEKGHQSSRFSEDLD